MKIWDCVILDEGHTVKNPLSSTAKSIFKLKAKCRIALSGTPIQNHVRTLHTVREYALSVRAILISMITISSFSFLLKSRHYFLLSGSILTTY